MRDQIPQRSVSPVDARVTPPIQAPGPSRNRCEQGVSKLTVLVFGTLAATALFIGYRVAPFYYSYMEIVNQMQTVIRVASSEPDEEIRRRLWSHVTKLGIPVEPNDLRIERDDRRMRIRMVYKEVLYVTWKGKDYDLWVFDFDANAEGEF